MDPAIEELIGQVRDIMWDKAGIVRDGTGLRHAMEKLQGLERRTAHPRTRRAFEARNILVSSLLVVRSALAREESRGGHYRTDFPAHDDVRFLKHSVVRGEKIRFQ